MRPVICLCTIWSIIALSLCPPLYTHTPSPQLHALEERYLESILAPLLEQECNDYEYMLCRQLLQEKVLSFDEKYKAIHLLADLVEQYEQELAPFKDELVKKLEVKAQELSEEESDDQSRHLQSRTITRAIGSSVTAGSQIFYESGNASGINILGARRLQNNENDTQNSDGSIAIDYVSNQNNLDTSSGATTDISFTIVNGDQGSNALSVTDTYEGDGAGGFTSITLGDVTAHRAVDMNSNSLKDTSSSSLSLDGNGNGVSVASGDNLDLNGDKITSVGTVNTDNISSNANSTIAAQVSIDMNGNSLQDLSGNALTLGTGSNNNNVFLANGDNLDLNGNKLQSAQTDTALTITQDTASSGSSSAAQDLTLETIDSTANANVGNIVLDADPNAETSTSIILKTGGAQRAIFDTNGLNVDNLTDNGTGQVTLGNNIDMNGNNLQNLSGSALTLGTGANAAGINIASGDSLDLAGDNITSVGTMNTDNISSNANSVVAAQVPIDMNGSNLQDRSGNALRLGTNGNGNNIVLESSDNLDLNTNDIIDVTHISGTTSEGTTLTIDKSTQSNSTNGIIDITLDAIEAETGDTANINFNVGANNGNLTATNLKSGSGTALVIDSNNNILQESSRKADKKHITRCNDETAEKVMRLEVCRFTRISTEQDEYGLVAEQVEQEIPEIITRDEYGNPRGVMYQRVGPLTLLAVQKQQQQIIEQEEYMHSQQQQIDDLSARCQGLEREVAELRQLMQRYIAAYTA